MVRLCFSAFRKSWAPQDNWKEPPTCPAAWQARNSALPDQEQVLARRVGASNVSGSSISTPPKRHIRTNTTARSSTTMSSMADAMMRSDGPQAEPLSDAPSAGRRQQARSSSRPRGPPSISTPGMQSDVGFPDDEQVDARTLRRTVASGRDVPRVVDTTAETLGIQFERFLDR